MHLEYDFDDFFKMPTSSIMYQDLQRIFSPGAPIRWSEEHLKVIRRYQIIDMLRHRAECFWGRRIAMTAHGVLALVPGDSQEGDLVVLSPGDEQIVQDFEGSISEIVRGVLVGECWKDVDMFSGARVKTREEMTVGFALE
ncbi:hypothetical protein IFR05_013905 [Cadophora sp. M221]|nr:hypothetical protein IFR05_013905 [Cadophora sp. M221]